MSCGQPILIRTFFRFATSVCARDFVVYVSQGVRRLKVGGMRAVFLGKALNEKLHYACLRAFWALRR